MEARDFTDILRGEGFTEVLDRDLPPGRSVPEHSHPFDAKLLITGGAFTLTRGGQATTYRPGEVLSVPAGDRHAELAGPEGARFIAGRRHKPA
jgi:quercetin dioxygenase-like cupin family protein